MAIIPPVIVQAPEPRGLRYGLLTAATGPLDLPEPAARGGGIRYEPVSCGAAHLWPMDCDPELEKQFDPDNPFVDADPFVVYATLVCGPVGHTTNQLEQKVRRRLANGEQTQAEAGLAISLAAAATPVLAGDPADIVSVVGELEQWLYGSAGAGYGNVGYLHASPRTAAYAAFGSLMVREAPLWKTPLGSIWVFGGGYPAGQVFASGHTTVWRAATLSVPPPRQTFDRQTNQHFLIAEREYAVAFDCVAAVSEFTPPGEGS